MSWDFTKYIKSNELEENEYKLRGLKRVQKIWNEYIWSIKWLRHACAWILKYFNGVHCILYRRD